MRLTTAGTAIVMLLAGLGGVVVAQDAGSKPVTPTGVIVTDEWISHDADPTESQTPDDAFVQFDGAKFTFEWHATDPRLNGTATYTGTWHNYPSIDGAQLEAVAWTVVNDDGGWSGIGRSIFSEGAEFGDNQWVILRGYGAYEGLLAYLSEDIAHEGGTWRGLIVADELPEVAAPDPAQ